MPEAGLDLYSFPEILEWLIGSHYREWALRTWHAGVREQGLRPSCSLMAKVLLSIGDLPGARRHHPPASTYADALQQLRTRSARRLPEDLLERTVAALGLTQAWRAFLEAKASEWNTARSARSYRKEVVENAITATLETRLGSASGSDVAPATRPRRSPGARRARTVAAWVTLALITLGVAAGLGLSAARNQAADPSRTSESVTPSRRLSGSPTRGHTADEVSAYLAELAGLAAEAGRGKQRIGSTMDAYLSGRISSGTAAYEIRKAIHNRQAILAVHKALVAPSDVRAQECGLAFETAMRHSIDADRHFLRIAEGHATREAAVHANDQAGRWKTDFTRQFNALAKAYGVHTRLSPKEI